MEASSHITVRPPRLPAALEPAPSPDTLRDDGRLADCLVASPAFDCTARRLSITHVRFHGARLTGALPAAELEDVRFEACDLANLEFSDAILLRVCFSGCRMTGVNLSGASMQHVSFEDCRLDYANFRFARFANARFSDCDCARAEFIQAALSHCTLSHIGLRQAQFSGTPLAGIDLTHCDIDGLGARPEDLRGAIISPEQAVTAAKLLGVIVR